MKQNSRFLFVFLVLGLFFACTRTPQRLASEKPAAPTVNLVSKKIRDSIVLIESENGSGIGFFVAPDKIATNLHSVAHYGPISVKSADEEKNWTIEGVVAFDTKNKIVILKITDEGTSLLLGDSRTVQIDEFVSIPGYSDGEFKITEGSIQNIRKNNKWLRVKATASNRTNGSPMLNNNGQVIGVIVPYDIGSYSYAMPSSALQVLLDSSMSIEPLAEWQKREHVRAAAYYGLGKEKLDAKDYAGAVVDFDKAIELNPAYVRAYYERGRVQAYLGNYDSAIASCTQVIEIDPDAPDAYYLRGSVKARLGGDYADAIVDLDKAIELDAQHADAYSNRGSVKFKLGESEAARGNAKAVQLLYEAAITDCDKAIEIDAEHAPAYGNRGALKFRLGEFETIRGNAKAARRLYEATVTDCDKAVRIDPNYADAYSFRGAAKSALGDPKKAMLDVNKAIQIDSEHAGAYRNRAKVKCELGDVESRKGNAEIAQKLYHEGITEYEKFIQMNTPEAADAKPADPEFIKSRASTVHIMGWNGTLRAFFDGSGFFADTDKVVTNLHGVAMPSTVFVKPTDREMIYPIEGVTAFDAENDLVILKITGEGTPLSLGDSDAVQSGERVITVGYPNRRYKVMEGTIDGIRNTDKWLRMKIDITGGSSGSPALNGKGQVIGINAARYKHYGYAIPSNVLKALLARSKLTEPLMEWHKRDHVRAYAYHVQGNFKSMVGHYRGAITNYDKAIKLNPKTPHIYYQRGNIKAVLGKYKAAIADYDKALQLNPENFEIYETRANVKFRLGDPEQAILDFSKIIQLDPDNANIYNNRGMMRFRFGASEFSGGNVEKAQALYEAAIEDYTQAIKLNPEHAEARSNLGTVKSALSAMRGQ
ncbi:hypothetical protein C6503_05795 [Candidatus Poribacteria bacterium]|nr:MAG: hypothetical protein C6503_05795 [Candidatus Poribacteria bacterium]